MSPAKPTRDDAAASERPEEMYDGAKQGDGSSVPQWARNQPGRHGGDDPVVEQQRHPPHVTENDENAPVQEDQSGASDIAALPANASGRDEVSSEQFAEDVNRESAYTGRPEEDKDQPPSKRAR